ncbi:hypothetical protein [Thiorhodovibrio frisius]|uniref:Uncharacterized protein n=1 Tax=Thiorhodovibrio frisius TaxID=631362 RepID=H8Z514_9GAMM|nr:hypothetical protein [Thiorhodovibrio frisius]EIC20421.1 hypothetical protein Thi970DRAFT_04055 [Thiorhodovibrio frisius]WPL21162.1 hypothetical protein Thiofri_01273 [Thiorhodovibrio frisius]
MNNDDLKDYVINLAELVGFDLEAGTWTQEPTELQQVKPGLPIALSRLFLALRCANPSDTSD